jgi:hypothetical protein
MSGPNDVGPATQGIAVTPTDDTAIPKTRALWVGSAGNIVVKFADNSTAPTVAGGTVTISGVLAGTLLPIAVVCVNDTLTTATDIVALY